MGTTTNFAFPYPAATDPVGNGYQDIQDLAEDLDTTLNLANGYVRAWSTSLSFNGSGDAQIAHGQGIAPVSFGAQPVVGSTLIVLTAGNGDSTYLNFTAWEDWTTNYTSASLSVVKIWAIFPYS